MQIRLQQTRIYGSLSFMTIVHKVEKGQCGIDRFKHPCMNKGSVCAPLLAMEPAGCGCATIEEGQEELNDRRTRDVTSENPRASFRSHFP
jgi:hypothetical protein